MPRKYPTPKERQEFEAFARSALGKPKTSPTAQAKADANQKATVKRVFAQEAK